MIEATAECFEASTQGDEELDEIVALHEFAQCAPEAVSSGLIDRIKTRLEEDGDIIFDCDISDADDEHDIDHLRNIARGFEKTFSVELSGIRERLDERQEEIRTRNDEPPDDWYDRNDEEGSDASDADIAAMFGALDD